MLQLHRAERADRLADALASVVTVPLADPFTEEVVAVPTRGVERWLTQRLALSLGAAAGRADGVCANVAFPFPGRLIGDAVATATGIDRDRDPWRPERLVWPLLEVVEQCLDDEWLAPLAAHLGHGAAPPAEADRPAWRGRRFAALRRITDLFDRYAVHCPDMLHAWVAGVDADGIGEPLPPDAAWQAALWRRLRERIGTPSPAERLAAACARLVDDPAVVELPERVSLFGLTRLPASHLDVLHAVATARDVHLFLLHPSSVLWDTVRATTPTPSATVLRGDDTSGEHVHSPLLARWGRDAREMQVVLGRGGDAADRHYPCGSSRRRCSSASKPTSAPTASRRASR